MKRKQPERLLLTVAKGALPNGDGKVCTCCGQKKQSLDFHKDKGKRDGLSPHCKVCACARTVKWSKENAVRKRESTYAWEKKNPHAVAAIKEKWRAENPERVRAAERARYAADPERYKAKAFAYRAANPERSKATSAKWAVANPERVRAKGANRRAMKKAADGTLSHGLA